MAQMNVKPITVEELLGIEKYLPEKPIQRNVQIILPDGRVLITTVWTGIKTSAGGGRSFYILTGVQGSFLDTKAIAKPPIRKKYRIVYLYTLRDGTVVALPTKTRKVILKRLKKIKERYKKLGYKVVIVR